MTIHSIVRVSSVSRHDSVYFLYQCHSTLLAVGKLSTKSPNSVREGIHSKDEHSRIFRQNLGVNLGNKIYFPFYTDLIYYPNSVDFMYKIPVALAYSPHLPSLKLRFAFSRTKMADDGDKERRRQNYEDFTEYPLPLRLVQANKKEQFINMVDSSKDKQSILNCAHSKSGDTPIIVASRHGHLELIKFLIHQGVDIEQRNKDLKRPLHEAAAGCHLDCVKLFILQNAEIDCLKRADW